MSLIETRDLTKVYKTGPADLQVLNGINLNIEEGEFVAIMGPSGSGKSTYMNILGCLDRPSAGKYWLATEDVSNLSDDRLAEIRCERFGFVFQSFNLLARTNALQQVEVPMQYAGRLNRAKRRERAEWALARVGLADRMDHRPNQLSGGQQQRVAIARALVNSPRIVFADEPTGNLDTHTGEAILELFRSLSKEGRTIALVTHNPEIAAVTPRRIEIRNGKISDHVDPKLAGLKH